jgi:hypothetical protein
MKACELAEWFWKAKPCRLGSRDMVVVEKSTVRYLVWGHEVARWDRDADMLEVDDCGWQTWLTRDRLNNILGDIDWGIYSQRGRWFIHHRLTDRSYYWERRHRIHISSGAIQPAKLKTERRDISNSLKYYYRSALAAINAKRRRLIIRTLDGTAYIFVDKPYGRRISTLLVKTHSPEFDAWEGRLHLSTICSAFIRSDASKILKELDKRLWRIEDRKAERVLSELRSMNFKPEDILEQLVPSLAVAKLLEF